MSADRLERGLHAATAEGLLPAGADCRPPDTRPWPVVLLTALGAWLAAVPLLGVVGLLLGDLISRGAGPYIVGVAGAGGAIVVLRSRERAAVRRAARRAGAARGRRHAGVRPVSRPAAQAAAARAGAGRAGCAVAIPRPWLRVLLGAAAAVLLALSPACPTRWAARAQRPRALLAGVASRACAVAGRGWCSARAQRRPRARAAAALESLARRLAAGHAGRRWRGGPA